MVGPGGGDGRARPAWEFSGGDVRRAVGESLAPVYCVDSNQEGVCQREDGCPTRVLWARLGKAVSEVLDATTLAELCTAPGSLAETRSKPERKGTSA